MALSNLPGPWRWEERNGKWWRVHDRLRIEDGPHPINGQKPEWRPSPASVAVELRHYAVVLRDPEITTWGVKAIAEILDNLAGDLEHRSDWS